jgi:tRNA (mo5U34)-methyltransferase
MEPVTQELARATEEFNRRALEMGLGDLRNYYWYHTIELPGGLVTPGAYDFRRSLPCFRFPEDMSGQRVLDVGSATGFFAFEFEKRGAKVVSVELPSLAALDRFPGQTVERSIQKIQRMLAPFAERKNLTARELYFYLLAGPFEFCRKLLRSRVERCLSTVYELSAAGLGSFDLVFMGDILVHTLNPPQALAAVAPLAKASLVLSQVMPDTADARPAMLYVGGEDPLEDDLSWWWPNQACLRQLLRKLGFREVVAVGHHTGVLRSSGYMYDRAILHAIR